MRKKGIAITGIIFVMLLACSGLNGISGYTIMPSVSFNELEKLRLDSLTLEEYSAKLQVELDSTCDPLFISTVAGWLGVRYRHAGYSKSGIDCSGFVAKIYKEVYNIDLTHSSSQMIYQMKTLVKRSELQMGDILFFRIHGRRISHVGLYLKDNKFVHASIYRGITVSNLTDDYYKKAYYVAGRPDPKYVE